MEIKIDTREQKPWKFPPKYHTTKIGMKDGDYTVVGYEDKICIERKSLDDLTNCLMDRDLQRFCGQIKRMRKYPYRAVIVEGELSQLLKGKYRAPMAPPKMLRRMVDVCLRFKVLFFMAPDAKNAATLATAFMESAVKQIEMD